MSERLKYNMLTKNFDKWTRATQLSVQNVHEIKAKKVQSQERQSLPVNVQGKSKFDIMHELLTQVLSVMNPYEEQQSEGVFSEIYMDNITGKVKGMNRILTVKNVNMTDKEIDDFYKEKGDQNDN